MCIHCICVMGTLYNGVSPLSLGICHCSTYSTKIGKDHKSGLSPLSHMHSPLCEGDSHCWIHQPASAKRVYSLVDRFGIYGKSWIPKSEKLKFSFWFCHLPTLWLWAHYTTSLNLTFLIYRMSRVSVKMILFWDIDNLNMLGILQGVLSYQKDSINAIIIFTTIIIANLT